MKIDFKYFLKKHWWKLGIGGVLLIAIIVCGIIFLPGLKRSHYDMVIRIPKNATYQNIADSISRYSDKEYAATVVKYMKMFGGDPSKRHGAYEITNGMSAFKAARLLKDGKQIDVDIKINGFRGKDLLVERISRKFDFNKKDLDSLISKDETFAPYGLTVEEGLALFIDGEYKFHWSDSPQEVIDKFGKHYKEVWNKDRCAKAKALKLKPKEVMILCSIADEETNSMEDKGIIGRLYINRINKGMKLQSCPTIRFALNDFNLTRLLNRHLTVESPYNTYIHPGLPPGPIRTTSVETIDQVLNSKPNDYLYMCASADFSDRHHFSSTFEEHDRYAKEYAKAYEATFGKKISNAEPVDTITP